MGPHTDRQQGLEDQVVTDMALEMVAIAESSEALAEHRCVEMDYYYFAHSI